MPTAISKPSTLLFASALAAIASLPSDATACAWSEDEEDMSRQTFFDPALIETPDVASYFYNPYQPFADGSSGVSDFREINLDDWDGFFSKRLPREVWAALLYKAPLSRLDELIFSLQGKRPATTADAPFASYPDRAELVAALFYVGFAKRVEPFATEKSDYWEWEAKQDKIDRKARDEAIASLIVRGGRAMARAKLPFLRQRYALQILRLHFYRGDDARCLTFFEERRADFSDHGSVAWRALGYKAGAFYRSKRYAEANYHYSLLFDRYRPMKNAALWSFHPQEEGDWANALALARTTREKTVLWQMLGIQKDGLRAMQAIYALAPKSSLLPLLLVREVNRVEVGGWFRDDDAPSDHQRALGAFIDQVASKGNTRKPWLWALAAAHLHALWGEVKTAERFLGLSGKKPQVGGKIGRQVRITRLLTHLKGMNSPTSTDEATLAKDFAWLDREMRDCVACQGRLEVLRSLARARLAAIYQKNGDAFSALCLGGGDDTHVYSDPHKLDQFIAYLHRTDRNAFQAMVAKACPTTPASLLWIKGLLALYRGDFEGAAAILATTKTETLFFNPFRIRTRDCHSCDLADVKAGRGERYTPHHFAVRLAALRKQAQTSPAAAAQAYFAIANGLYNMSTYGSFRGLVSDEDIASDCTLAESYYRKALQAATRRELKARSAFMAAKCELNNWYNHAGRKHQLRWFRTLRDDYADTQFYQDIIRECGYFRHFVQTGKLGIKNPGRP